MTDQEKRVAVVGGGIAGLFCARILGERGGYKVDLFETASRLGGRIRTVRLDRNNQELVGIHEEGQTAADGTKAVVWTNKKLNFYVEFGPMRLELDKQLLLKALLDDLGITAREEGARKEKKNETKPYLVPFPSYTSPASEHDPRYELAPEEQGKSPIELMVLAFVRILAHLEVEGSSTVASKLQDLKDGLKLAAALDESTFQTFSKWVKELQPEDYWELQTLGCITIPDPAVDSTGQQKKVKVPLYRLGFWNLLSTCLSHDALNKIRDLGTFYHLLPENPNAAEWLVWWMIGLSASDNTQGIFGGMECIVDAMRAKLKDLESSVNIQTGKWITAILKGDNGKLGLRIRDSKARTDSDSSYIYDHVVLAVPRRAAQEIQRRSHTIFNDAEVEGLLESAFGFPMVKTFVVLKERWWERNNMANRSATRMPTRELHYWKPHVRDDRQGLIMAYTDRPASAYWADYVPSGPQIDAHRDKPSLAQREEAGEDDKGKPGEANKEGKSQETEKGGIEMRKPLNKALRIMLIERMADYLDKNNGEQKVQASDIAWYGIRDWGRAPFSGANHAWRPGRKYWVVMRRLADLEVEGSPARIHVCGEAYSDYHGFIEGPLRSAAYVLHRLLEEDFLDGDEKKQGALFSTFLTAGKPRKGGAKPRGLEVNGRYLEGLQSWARNLDTIKPKTPGWQFMD